MTLERTVTGLRMDRPFSVPGDSRALVIRRPITSAARSRKAVPDGVKENLGRSMRPWEPLLASSPGVPCL